MNTFAKTLLALSLIVSVAAIAEPGKQPGKRDKPTKLAHYQMSTYVDKSDKLHVNVNKQLGGKVSIQFVNAAGLLLFDQTLTSGDTMARLKLDLAELTDGDYLLKVSNGLEVEMREIKIATQAPATSTRLLTVL